MLMNYPVCDTTTAYHFPIQLISYHKTINTLLGPSCFTAIPRNRFTIIVTLEVNGSKRYAGHLTFFTVLFVIRDSTTQWNLGSWMTVHSNTDLFELSLPLMMVLLLLLFGTTQKVTVSALVSFVSCTCFPQAKPVMTCYKLVTCEFKWFGLQNRVEEFIQSSERRLFTTFHRKVFCSIDRWYGLTMADIRALEEKTKHELDKVIIIIIIFCRFVFPSTQFG